MTEPLSLSQLAARKERRSRVEYAFTADALEEAEADIDSYEQIIAKLVAAGEVLSNGAPKEAWRAWRTLLRELGEK